MDVWVSDGKLDFAVHALSDDSQCSSPLIYLLLHWQILCCLRLKLFAVFLLLHFFSFSFWEDCRSVVI